MYYRYREQARSHRGSSSNLGEAFQADERACLEQFGQDPAIGQAQIRRGQFRQRIQHEGPFLHVVMGNLEARFVDQAITEQQDVEVQRCLLYTSPSPRD